MTDVATQLEGVEVLNFIPELYKAMMLTPLEVAVKAYCPNGIDPNGFGRRCRVVEPKTSFTIVGAKGNGNTVSVARTVKDDTGIAVRVRVTKREATWSHGINASIVTSTECLYSISMTVMDTNLIKNKNFDTGLRRYRPKGIGYNFFIGPEVAYDGSVPFKQFLLDNVPLFVGMQVEIDEKLAHVKSEYAIMRQALNRF